MFGPSRTASECGQTTEEQAQLLSQSNGDLTLSLIRDRQREFQSLEEQTLHIYETGMKLAQIVKKNTDDIGMAFFAPFFS